MYKSNICIAVLVSYLALVAALTDENKSHVQSLFVEAGEKCITEHPITEEDIASFKERQFPEGSNASCFSACVLKKIGFMDDKGVLSPTTGLEQAKKFFDSDDELKTVQEFFDTCSGDAESTGDDGCDRAKLVFKCFVNNAEKFDFLA